MIMIITIMMFNCDKHFQSTLYNNVVACYLCFYNFFVFVILINKMHIEIAFYFNSLFFDSICTCIIRIKRDNFPKHYHTTYYESLFS